MDTKNQSSLQQLIDRILIFRDARDWKQFHNPKDMSLSLVLEATEVMEHFQWKTPKQTEEYVPKNKDKIGEELADVLYWVLLMSNDLKIDLLEMFNKKMIKNESKYPVAKSKGNAIKYTELR